MGRVAKAVVNYLTLGKDRCFWEVKGWCVAEINRIRGMKSKSVRGCVPREHTMRKNGESGLQFSGFQEARWWGILYAGSESIETMSAMNNGEQKGEKEKENEWSQRPASDTTTWTHMQNVWWSYWKQQMYSFSKAQHGRCKVEEGHEVWSPMAKAKWGKAEEQVVNE